MKGEAQKRRKRWPISWLQEEEETRYQEGSSSNPGTGYYLPGWIFLIFVYNENVLIEKTCTKLDRKFLFKIYANQNIITTDFWSKTVTDF